MFTIDEALGIGKRAGGAGCTVLGEEEDRGKGLGDKKRRLLLPFGFPFIKLKQLNLDDKMFLQRC